MAYVRKYYGYAEASRHVDKSNNELMQEVQTEIMLYKECTDKKLKKLEEMMDLAMQKMSMIKSMRPQNQDKEETMHHLKPIIPNSEEHSGVFDCEQQLANFGIGSKAHEWPNHTEELPDASQETYSHETYTVELYYSQFEGYMEQLKERMPFLTEGFFVESFVSGLQANVKKTLKLLNPTTLEQAFRQAKKCKEPKEVVQKVDQSCDSVGSKSGTIPHLKMNVSTIEGAGIFESLHVCEQLLDVQTNYDVEPVYDEEPGEGQECWPEHEFILAALRGDNSYSSKPSQPEICTSERSDTSEDLSYIEVIQDRNNHNSLEKMTPILLEEVSSVIFSHRETIEIFLSKRILKDFPTTEIPYDLGIQSSNFDKGNMLIFDPGGQVKNEQSKGVNNKLKAMISSEVKLEEAVMKISVGSQPRYWQDSSSNFLAMEQLLKETSQLQRKGFITEIGNSARVESQNVQKKSDGFDKIVSEINQQYVDAVSAGMIVLPYKYNSMVLEQDRPELDNSLTPEYYEGSRKGITIYIFDPGGDLVCHHGVLLVVSAGIPEFEQLLQDVFKGKDLYTKGKERTRIEPLSRMYEAGQGNKDDVQLATMRTWCNLRGKDCQD